MYTSTLVTFFQLKTKDIERDEMNQSNKTNTIQNNEMTNQVGEGNKTIAIDQITKQTNRVSEVTKTNAIQTNKQWDIVWVNVCLLLLLHLGALYGFYLKLTSPYHGYLSSGVCKFFAVSSAFGITAGAHRLWSHRAYQASWKAQILLMFMATLTYQNSIYNWARDHRLHHKYSETDADPHNAKRGLFFSHVGWLLIRKHSAVKSKGIKIDMSDLRRNPIVMFQHRHYVKLVLLIAVLLPITIERLIVGAPWRETIFIYTIYRYVVSVNTTWCVNSLAHLYGNKPYDIGIGPADNKLMKIIGMGEGFHNYHHTYPWDYKAAEFGDDSRNLTTVLIDVLAWFGWVWGRKTVPEHIIHQRVIKTGCFEHRDTHMKGTSLQKFGWNVIYFGLVSLYIIFA